MFRALERLVAVSVIRSCAAILAKFGSYDLRNVEPGFVKRVDRLDVHSRDEFILDRCKGKRVLDLGCSAYPFTEERLRQGNLLHQKLLAVCSSLVGADNSEEATLLLKRELGVDDIYVLDVYDLACQTQWDKFDVVVAGEIIEHLTEPGTMLRGAASLLTDDGVLIATVPNAFKYRNFFATQRSLEIVHDDHCAWYSCRTIRTLFTKCGYENVNVSGYCYGNHWIGRHFVQRSSLFCDGLIVEAKPGPAQGGQGAMYTDPQQE